MADAFGPPVAEIKPASLNGATAPHVPKAEPRFQLDTLFFIWSTMVAGMLVFLVFGVVRVEAGVWAGRRMSVPVVWYRFIGFLNDLGASPAIVVTVAVTGFAALCGAVYTLWLAFRLTDAPIEPDADGRQ